jgi:hypothetical protein
MYFHFVKTPPFREQDLILLLYTLRHSWKKPVNIVKLGMNKLGKSISFFSLQPPSFYYLIFGNVYSTKLKKNYVFFKPSHICSD